MRFEGRRDFLSEESVPVYPRKERMGLEFSGIIFSTKTMFRVAVQELKLASTHFAKHTPLTNDFPSADSVSFGKRTFPNAMFLYICCVSSA